MKLFNPKTPNAFVIAAVPTNARDGVAPTYVAVTATAVEDAEASLLADKKAPMRNAYPYVMGRYDERGCYMVYKPPIDGITPGRFVIHPLAEAEMAQEGWH